MSLYTAFRCTISTLAFVSVKLFQCYVKLSQGVIVDNTNPCTHLGVTKHDLDGSGPVGGGSHDGTFEARWAACEKVSRP
jgi:hypothetical protein